MPKWSPSVLVFPRTSSPRLGPVLPMFVDKEAKSPLQIRDLRSGMHSSEQILQSSVAQLFYSQFSGRVLELAVNANVLVCGKHVDTT